MSMAWLAFLGLGAIAGVLAGLLGVGGGLVLVAALAWMLPLLGVPQEAAMHAALASSLASIVLTAAASARAHARRGGGALSEAGGAVGITEESGADDDRHEHQR